MSGNVIKFNEEDEDDDDEGDIAGLLARHREQVQKTLRTSTNNQETLHDFWQDTENRYTHLEDI